VTGRKHIAPTVRAVDIAQAEFGREVVTVLVEDEERMVADGLEVAVTGPCAQ
jgi:hypothetical protein